MVKEDARGLPAARLPAVAALPAPAPHPVRQSGPSGLPLIVTYTLYTLV
jgi:hypothetical protein